MNTTLDTATPPRPTTRETWARWWFGGIAVVVAIALVIQIILIFTGGQDANSGANATGPVGTRLVRLFSFFTIQSNLFVRGTSIAQFLSIRRDGRLWRVLRLDVLAAAFIWPLRWLVYTFVHGAITGWYPYPFLDVTTIGLADSLRDSGVVLAIGVVIAVILVLVDRHVPALIDDRRRKDDRRR